MLPRYSDRTEAGRELARALQGYAGTPGLLVIGLPRGGVPVAYEVARALGAPLDVFLVRKLGVPGREELAMGAISSGDVLVLNSEVVDLLDIPREAIENAVSREREELSRRERAYRGDRPVPEISGRTVIVVDDGLATGSSMRAAVAALRTHGPSRIVVAVPVAPPETVRVLQGEVDEVVCPLMPADFAAVGLWFEDFSQTTDDEVRELLARAHRELPAEPAAAPM